MANFLGLLVCTSGCQPGEKGAVARQTNSKQRTLPLHFTLLCRLSDKKMTGSRRGKKREIRETKKLTGNTREHFHLHTSPSDGNASCGDREPCGSGFCWLGNPRIRDNEKSTVTLRIHRCRPYSHSNRRRPRSRGHRRCRSGIGSPKKYTPLLKNKDISLSNCNF